MTVQAAFCRPGPRNFRAPGTPASTSSHGKHARRNAKESAATDALHEMMDVDLTAAQPSKRTRHSLFLRGRSGHLDLPIRKALHDRDWRRILPGNPYPRKGSARRAERSTSIALLSGVWRRSAAPVPSCPVRIESLLMSVLAGTERQRNPPAGPNRDPSRELPKHGLKMTDCKSISRKFSDFGGSRCIPRTRTCFVHCCGADDHATSAACATRATGMNEAVLGQGDLAQNARALCGNAGGTTRRAFRPRASERVLPRHAGAPFRSRLRQCDHHQALRRRFPRPLPLRTPCP